MLAGFLLLVCCWAELPSLILVIFLLPASFFCHTLLAAISLLVFLLAFRVNWQYGEGPDEANVTDKQQQIKQKRKYLLQS